MGNKQFLKLLIDSVKDYIHYIHIYIVVSCKEVCNEILLL